MRDTRRWRRLGGAAAVALLHVLLVWALLVYSRQANEKPWAVAEHEIFFVFPPHRPPPQRNGKPARREAAPAAPAISAPPDYRGITIPDSPGAAPPPGLGRSLFGCSAQEMADLPPQERARCANAMAPDNSVDWRDGTSRSRAAALWERGRERKNAPLLLPCMSPTAPPSISAYTVYCLAKGAITGFDPDSQPSYADTQEKIHVPNNGDAPDSPTYGR